MKGDERSDDEEEEESLDEHNNHKHYDGSANGVSNGHWHTVGKICVLQCQTTFMSILDTQITN